jgi:hypothetical protein
MVVACCWGLSSSRELPHGCFGAILNLFPCFDRAEGLYDADTVVPQQAPVCGPLWPYRRLLGVISYLRDSCWSGATMQLPSQVQNLQRCRSVSPLRGCLSAPLRSGMYVLVPRGSTPGCHDVRVGPAIPASGAAYVHVVQRSINPWTRPDRVRPRFTTRMPPVHARLWVIYCALPT